MFDVSEHASFSLTMFNVKVNHDKNIIMYKFSKYA